MAKYKGVPVAAAKAIAEKYDKNQVIVVAWDAAHGKEHVTSYGATKLECEQAAEGARRVQKALNWPPDQIIKVKPTFDKEEIEVLREMAQVIADSCGEDIIGGLMRKTNAFNILKHDEGKLCRLADKLTRENPNVCKESSIVAYGMHLLEKEKKST